MCVWTVSGRVVAPARGGSAGVMKMAVSSMSVSSVLRFISVLVYAVWLFRKNPVERWF